MLSRTSGVCNYRLCHASNNKCCKLGFTLKGTRVNNIHCFAHRSRHVLPILSQINAVYVLKLYLSYMCLTFWHRSFTFNSNKSPSWCNNFSVYYSDVCLQLNMFRAFSRPSSGAQWLQWLCSWSGRTARLSPRYESKTRGCHCSHWAPDDRRENARNMLSCKQTSGW